MKKFIIGILLGGLLLSGGWFAWGAIQSEIGTYSATDPQPYGTGTTLSRWTKTFSTAYTNSSGTVLALFRRDTIVPATHSALWAASSTGVCSGGETCFYPVLMAKGAGGNNDMSENGYLAVGIGVRNIDTNTTKMLTVQSTYGDTETFGADSNSNNSIVSLGLGYGWNGSSWDRIRNQFTQTTTGITTNAAGTAVNMTTTPMSKYTLIIDRTVGTTDAVAVNLECSYDGTIWPGTTQSLIAVTTLAVEPTRNSVGDAPCNYVRYNVVTVGDGNTLTIQLIATR